MTHEEIKALAEEYETKLKSRVDSPKNNPYGRGVPSYFSFGYGQCAPNKFIALDSRKSMCELFEDKWSFQYPWSQAQKELLESHNMQEISIYEALIAFHKPDHLEKENQMETETKIKLCEAAERHGHELSAICNGLAADNGWWDNPRPVPELLMLCVSELAEAMEGARKDLMDDHLTHRKMLEVELADTVIRVFDMAGGLGLDIGGAIAEKLAYNCQRADHKPENRAKEGGKKF